MNIMVIFAGDIGLRHRSPYLNKAILMFQPYVDNTRLISNNSNPLIISEWEYTIIPFRHPEIDLDPYYNNDYFPDYPDE